jgi:plasmid replication initiation protein
MIPQKSRAKRATLTGDQFDLFLPYLTDLPLRDQREMMERPFFSLAKSKRSKPIDYRSPDGKIWVHVSGNPDYGMATIWDADILIYCASILNDMKRRGINDIPRSINIMPYDLLRSIDRPTTGRAYELLGQSLDRLVSTTVKTNIRADNRREATFSWIDGWTQLVDEKTERSKGMTIELSNWFYEGVMMTGGVLAIERAYFRITGGRERWLYKVARKHAGGAGEGGFAISMPTLFEKSGAEGDYRRFKFEIAKIAAKNALPGYALELEQPAGKKEPSLRMRRRDGAEPAEPVKAAPRGQEASPLHTVETATPAPGPLIEGAVNAKAAIRQAIAGLTQKAVAGYITDTTLEQLREQCPGWDYQTLHAEFKSWINGDAKRTPVNYQAAFIGFVKRHHEANKHLLPGR